jgi:putative transposase
MDNKTKYNPAIHRRRSIRLKGYDYSQNGLYFITICTYNRECLFGEIIYRKIILNDAGKIADECWLKIPEHFPNAVLHEHVVMPNHVHGIIELANVVGVQNFEPLPPPKNQFQHIIPRSIGSIVRGYKIGVTKYFRDNTDIYRVWQRNYHEHIIRNEQSYWRISEYIINNPDAWENDKFYRMM